MSRTQLAYADPGPIPVLAPSLFETSEREGARSVSHMIAAVRLSAILYTAAATIAFAGVTPSAAERPTISGAAKRADSEELKSAPREQGERGIEYRNLRYGFCFSLPANWGGYSIVVDRWQGYTNGPGGDVTVEQGPIILIRDPRWTSAEPRQDIPIMVFAQKQWRSLQRKEFAVSPAPFGPPELGRNRNYVFGLPPRYNYAFPPGYRGVDQILRSKPFDSECLSHRTSK